MSRKQDPFPWRVIAIAAVLFVAFAAIGWLVFGPSDTTSPTPAAGGGGGISDPAAEPPAGGQPAPPTGEGGQPPPDPSTAEGRAALAALRAGAGTMDLQLFLIVPGLERLVPVSHTVAAPTTLDAQVESAVRELINWNGTQTTSPVAPETRLRETWVSPGGIAYLDFDSTFAEFSSGGSLGELQTIYGIVATVTESFPEIVAVQFLLEGEPMDTLAGHIDLSRPLLPSRDWVLLDTSEPQRQQSDDAGP
jgi:hypothetical protein